MGLNIRTPKTINFPFVPNGKSMVLGIPIFKHIRVNNFNAQLNTAIQLLAFVKENMFFH